ncbi:MAG: DUF6588 family protein [Candidatus Krumholzibacteriia bacterium]
MSRPIQMFLVVLALAALVVPAVSEDLEQLLTRVGEQYAKGYAAPLVSAWGANQNSALYHTADIPHTGLTFAVGLKFMGTHLNEDDQTFQTVLQDVELSNFLPTGHPFYNATGDVVMRGPTIFGDTETDGTMTAYVGGLPVYQFDAIPGLVDTRWVPLAAPQLDVGGIYGLRASLRWVPEVDVGDYGKTKYVGYGLSWSPGFLLPPLPVDVMVGFFTQQIDVGTIVETDATSFYLAASKNLGLITGYAGVAAESSSLKVAYTFEEPGFDPVDVDFTLDGEQSARFTLGATLNGPVKLNVEMNVGTLAVYSAGIMFGM